MEIYSRNSEEYKHFKKLLDAVIHPHREWPEQVFLSVNKADHIFFESDNLLADPPGFFENLITFISKTGGSSVILTAGPPVFDFYPTLPMIKFDKSDTPEVFKDLYVSPLGQATYTDGGRGYIGYSQLGSMNTIMLDEQMNWLLYFDFYSFVGVLKADEKIKKEFSIVFDDLMLSDSDVCSIANRLYRGEYPKLFIENYVNLP